MANATNTGAAAPHQGLHHQDGQREVQRAIELLRPTISIETYGGGTVVGRTGHHPLSLRVMERRIMFLHLSHFVEESGYEIASLDGCGGGKSLDNFSLK
jgi:hypothetical protein